MFEFWLHTHFLNGVPTLSLARGELDGLELLIAASEAHMDNALLQAQTAGALRNMSLNDAVAERMAYGGAVDALINAATHHLNNSKARTPHTHRTRMPRMRRSRRAQCSHTHPLPARAQLGF